MYANNAGTANIARIFAVWMEADFRKSTVVAFVRAFKSNVNIRIP